MTTNALGLARTAHALKAAGLDRVNVSLDSVRPETFHAVTRRDRLHDVVDGLTAARRGRSRADQDQRGAAARSQRRPGGRAAALVPRPRLRPAVHRADAARRPARLEPRRDDHRRRDLHQPREGVRAQPGHRAPGECPGRAVPGRRRSRHRRRDRLGDPAVLWRLRPGTADRRRSGTQLPVRPRGVRPASSAADGATDEEIADRLGDRDGAASCAGHGIDDPTVPPARPADVGHRRLDPPIRGVASVTGGAMQASAGRRLPVEGAGCQPVGGCRNSAGAPRAGRRTRRSAGAAGGPHRRARTCGGRRVQLRVVPDAAPRLPALGSPWRSDTSSLTVSTPSRVKTQEVPDSHGGSCPALQKDSGTVWAVVKGGPVRNSCRNRRHRGAPERRMRR